jgi:hypothetical protein
MDKANEFNQKKKPGQQQPGQAERNEKKRERDQWQRSHDGPSERSDKEAIDRPVQLDKEPGKARPSSDGGHDQPRRPEPAGA